MADQQFSEAQLNAIRQLSEALQQCQALNIHLAGITDFQVQVFEDANGRQYAAII